MFLSFSRKHDKENGKKTLDSQTSIIYHDNPIVHFLVNGMEICSKNKLYALTLKFHSQIFPTDFGSISLKIMIKNLNQVNVDLIYSSEMDVQCKLFCFNSIIACCRCTIFFLKNSGFFYTIFLFKNENKKGCLSDISFNIPMIINTF